jgi:ubiquitin-protein ligase
MTDTAIQRIMEELEDIENDPLTDLGCDICLVDENNYYLWEGMIQGPEDTPYRGAFLYFTIEFPKNFPSSRPEFKFTNKDMYHLNVDSDGHVCISILNSWEPKTKVRQILYAIFTILYEQNPDSSYWTERAKLYKENTNQFDKNIVEWVRNNALTIK